MVKYATKGEKEGRGLTAIFNDVIGKASDTDNPQTKMRSLMINSVCGKRDIGQCEISRLLLSEPMYHSTFEYVSQSLDLDKRQLNTDNDNPAVNIYKKSIMDYYADREGKSPCVFRIHQQFF